MNGRRRFLNISALLGACFGSGAMRIRGENRLGAGAVLRSFPPLSFSYYPQVNAEGKTFKIANIRHLQLQGRQNTTIEVSLRLL